jgi:hypothetical protein
VPDFDIQVDSGVYECLSTNALGSASREIIVDKRTVTAAIALLSKRKRQEHNPVVVHKKTVSSGSNTLQFGLSFLQPLSNFLSLCLLMMVGLPLAILSRQR